MRGTFAVAGAICSMLLTAACSGPVSDDDAPSPSRAGASPYGAEVSVQRSQLLDIPRGAPPRSGWFRGATIWAPGAVDAIRLELTSRERSSSVVPYRGGYLAVVARRGRPSEAVVFDAEGRLLRRLPGCVQGLVQSPDRALVAWLVRDCGGSGSRTLRVGPVGDRRAPDEVVPLPAWGRAPAYPNGYPAIATAVGRWGVLVEVTDGIRGYSEGVYVVQPRTGEVHRVPGAAGMFAVSPQGIACCVGDSLIDLDDLEVVGPPGAIEAWSPDGTQGLVQRRRQRRVDVVDTRTGTVLRSLTLPAAVTVRSGQWEDDVNLTFELYRYSRGSDELFSTIVRVTPSGAVERVTGVTEGDPHVL